MGLKKSIPPFFVDSFIQVEMTDICNLLCYFCPHTRGKDPHPNKKSHMSVTLFKKIIDDLVKENIKFGTFEPFWLGESLLHPDFKEMFSYFLQYKEKICTGWQLDTNATVLTENLSEFILKQNNNFPSKIHFSIDAFSREIYLKMRRKDLYKQVINNIIIFLEKRKSLGLNFPEPLFQFIVTKANYFEATQFTNYWNNRLKELRTTGTISLKELDSNNNKENMMLFNNIRKDRVSKYSPKNRFIQRDNQREMELQVCAAPFKTLIISKDGKATICCADGNLELEIGNVNDNSIYEIWSNNSKLNQFRIDILKGKYIPKKCQICGFKFSPNLMRITKSEAIEFLKAIRKEDQIKEIPILNNKTTFLDFKWLRQNFHLTFETNATCNLNCRMCSQSLRWIKGGHLEYDLFKQSIDQFIKEGISFYSFSPFFRGEPLLNPDFEKIIKYLIKKSEYHFFKIITIHTNATLLTKKKTRALLDLYLAYPGGEIFFSIDAATKETYKKVRVGGNFEIVMENIEYFIKEKARRKITNLKMVFQFIVQDENFFESKIFIEIWKKILTKYDENFVISNPHDHLIPMHEYETNIIYFRRREPKDGDKKPEEYYRKLWEKVIGNL